METLSDKEFERIRKSNSRHLKFESPTKLVNIIFSKPRKTKKRKSKKNKKKQ